MTIRGAVVKKIVLKIKSGYREAVDFLYNFIKDRGVEQPAIGYSLE